MIIKEGVRLKVVFLNNIMGITVPSREEEGSSLQLHRFEQHRCDHSGPFALLQAHNILRRCLTFGQWLV